MATGDSTRPGPGAADEPLIVEALTDRDSGRWQITTHTSIYLLDLDRRHLTRIPGAGPHADGQTFHVTAMSIDHRAVPLAKLVVCQLGYGLYTLINPGRLAGQHWSISTPIVEIRRLGPHTTAQSSTRADRDDRDVRHDRDGAHHDRDT